MPTDICAQTTMSRKLDCGRGEFNGERNPGSRVGLGIARGEGSDGNQYIEFRYEPHPLNSPASPGLVNPCKNGAGTGMSISPVHWNPFLSASSDWRARRRSAFVELNLRLISHSEI
jgi:hypothetical protein